MAEVTSQKTSLELQWPLTASCCCIRLSTLSFCWQRIAEGLCSFVSFVWHVPGA